MRKMKKLFSVLLATALLLSMVACGGEDMLAESLKKRNVPDLLGREEMLEILLEEEYGHMPPKPDEISWIVEPDVVANFCAGKASYSKVTISCELNGQTFLFPVSCVIPNKEGKHPFFVHINFRDSVPDRYMPTEELIDEGFAVLSFCYEDVTKDNADFTDGLAGILYPNGERESNDAGKIAMWAWAAQRVMDYAETLDNLDMDYSVVCGHSRLGKTALLTAATDERFQFAYSNDSGCSGAAITRDKIGERVSDICNNYSYWFCENYQKYMGKEHEMPFEQHYLLASIAPRYVCVGSAAEDTWSDPASEMLCCVAASPAYEAHGVKGFISKDRFPEVGDKFFEGSIGYHMRSGAHYFSREDWLRLIDFIHSKTK